VLLNRGDGSFEAKRDYATGRNPASVAVDDLNGDGNLDLATANPDANSVSVLLNRGDGTFRARRDYAGQDPKSVAIGDLNGDGRPDLATANNTGNAVSVLLNKGDGGFRARRDYAARRFALSVAIGDLNGDGKPDLATANNNGDNSASVLLNKGDGSFQAGPDYATGAQAAGPQSVAIGDLNGDGRPEVATTNFGTGGADTVSVLLNRPGLCTVQNVEGKTLQTAKLTLARANCRVGKVTRTHKKLTRTYKERVRRGRVISQRPTFGAVLPGGAKVNLVVRRGRKPS
jgi:hypothetical protein